MSAIYALFFGVVMIYASASSRLEAYVRVIGIQGIMLFLCVLTDRQGIPLFTFVFLCVETLVFKAAVIPWFLMYTIRKNGIMREVEPYMPNFYSVVATTLIFVAGFAASFMLLSQKNLPALNAVYFGAAAGAVITGLFIIVSRKKIITHVMGFIMMENGIFLLSLSVPGEMPFIVNFGVLLDFFIAVFLLGLFISRINSTFEELEIDRLSELKD